MKHYTKAELELYRHGEMGVLGRLQCSRHLRECPTCARRMKELGDDDALVGELRESLRFYRDLPAAEPRRSASTRHRTS